MRVDLPLDKKLWKIKTGPPGHWALAGRGPLCLQAAGPLGCRGPVFSKTPDAFTFWTLPWSQRLSFNIVFFDLEICDAKY